jgi:hypothetical protein
MLATASAVAALAAAVFVAVTLAPSRSVGWAEVTQAIQAQKWIRGATTNADGKRATMWLAPERGIWAFDLFGSYYFNDDRAGTHFEYRTGDKVITRLPLSKSDNSQRVLPTKALAGNEGEIGEWLMGTEKVVKQQRREITEEGKAWVEFQLVLGRGEMNHVTLRVDPATRLPVYLLSVSPKDNQKTAKWTFDYPADGPTDLYALGVPRDIKIDDRMPADNVQQALAAMAARRSSLGDFRLIVEQSPQLGSSVVYRRGNQWRVEAWRASAAPVEPGNRDWDNWLAAQKPTPLFVCDGTTVWENTKVLPGEAPQWKLSQHTAPQDLLSGEGLGMLSGAPGAKIASLVYPDLSPKRGWGFEFDANPAEPPVPGGVLLKRSTGVTFPAGMIAHEWYYLDPQRGYAVVLAELFTLPPDAEPTPPAAGSRRQTFRLEAFEQSPPGFWYPTVVHNSMANLNGQPRMEATSRYHFDFAAKLPDELFRVDEGR